MVILFTPMSCFVKAGNFGGLVNKKRGCPQEGEGHPNKRVSMVLLFITKMVRYVNKKTIVEKIFLQLPL